MWTWPTTMTNHLAKYAGKGPLLDGARGMWYHGRWLRRALRTAEAIKPLLDVAPPEYDADQSFQVFGASSDRYNAKTVEMLLELSSVPLGEVTCLQQFFPRFRLEWTCQELSRSRREWQG